MSIDQMLWGWESGKKKKKKRKISTVFGLFFFKEVMLECFVLTIRQVVFYLGLNVMLAG
jgi:hypothetical protein